MNKVSILSVGALLALTTACNHTPTFTIEGTVTQAEGQMLYLHSLSGDRITPIDSAQLTAGGEFTFSAPQGEYPEFYRLTLGDSFISLAVDSTETISVEAQGDNFAGGYEVEGSDNCVKMRDIAQLNSQLIRRLIQLDEQQRAGSITSQEMQEAVTEAVTSCKEKIAMCVYENPTATAAYFAIFQRINDVAMFNPYNKEDFKAIGAVATSYSIKYPNWYRTQQLTDMSLKAMAYRKQLTQPQSIDEMEVSESAYIDIALNDPYNKEHKLSQYVGKGVVLLDFTAYQADQSPAYNIALANLYDKYHAKGFEIYQVSYDTHVNFWQVSASNLPWVCVRDAAGTRSRTASAYNIQSLPTAFLFDPQGEMVMRVSSIDELEQAIKKLL